MRVVLTGASGFIGSRLLARLAGGENSVLAVTRDRKRIPALPGVTVVETDLSEPAALDILEQSLGNAAAAAVIHLAANLDFYGSRKRLCTVNTAATERLARWSAERGIPRFVFASSVEAAGPVDAGTVPAPEDIAPRPVSPYGESKLAAEQRLSKIAGSSPLTAVVLRLGNVYGPGSPFLVPDIAAGIRTGSPLLRWRAAYGDRLFNPVFVEDVARALLAALRAPLNGCRIFSVCGPETVTFEGLCEKVSAVTGRPLPTAMTPAAARACTRLRTLAAGTLGRCDTLSYVASGTRDRVHRVFSAACMRAELGYAPDTPLDEGIKITLNNEGYYEDRNS